MSYGIQWYGAHRATGARTLCMPWRDRGTVLHRPQTAAPREKPTARHIAIPSSHGQSVVLPRPLQHLQMSAPSGQYTRPLVPRAVVLAHNLSPTLAPPDARPQQHMHTSTRPTGSGTRAPTSAPPGVCPDRHMHTCFGPTGSRAPTPTSAPPGVRHDRHMHTIVYSSHGQPCSRAHFSTSGCPP
jgi:hypothetical protein